MPNYQHITIVGHVGRDPEVKYTASGDAVANFSVAVTDKYGEKENTTWFRCVAWKKLAEVIGSYLKKGHPVLVSGRMQCRQYDDKDGNKRESWELVASQMQMLGGKAAERRQEKASAGSGFGDMDNDIPF